MLEHEGDEHVPSAAPALAESGSPPFTPEASAGFGSAAAAAEESPAGAVSPDTTSAASAGFGSAGLVSVGCSLFLSTGAAEAGVVVVDVSPSLVCVFLDFLKRDLNAPLSLSAASGAYMVNVWLAKADQVQGIV